MRPQSTVSLIDQPTIRVHLERQRDRFGFSQMKLHGQEGDQARIRCSPRLQPPFLARLLNGLAGEGIGDLGQIVVDGFRNPYGTKLFGEQRQAVDAGEIEDRRRVTDRRA